MIILASKSPRRKELLENIGIKPLIIVSEADENINETDPEKLVLELSSIKADAVYKKIKEEGNPLLNKGDYILGADTVVYAEGKILGKPKDKEDARAMIRALSGNVHSVFTGFTLIDHQGKHISESVETKVYVYEMSGEEIESYISSDEPYDKAGAYGIQGLFGKYVEKIDGDYNNVVGLPVSAIYETIKMINQSE